MMSDSEGSQSNSGSVVKVVVNEELLNCASSEGVAGEPAPMIHGGDGSLEEDEVFLKETFRRVIRSCGVVRDCTYVQPHILEYGLRKTER